MKFAYVPLATRRPVYSLAGAQLRYRPLIPLQVNGVHGSRLFDCSLDSGVGHAGFLQFFDVQLLGDRHEAVLIPNASFPGITHRRPLSQ